MLVCIFQLFGSRIKSIFRRYARAQNPHLRFSKLRFLALRKPKTISFYSTSAVLEKLLLATGVDAKHRKSTENQ